MHHHAPIPAAKPHLSLNAFSVPPLSGEDRNGSGESPPFDGTLASRNALRFRRTSAAEMRESDFDTEGFIRLVSPSSTRGHASGLSGALRLGVVLLRFQRPFGVSVPPRTSL